MRRLFPLIALGLALAAPARADFLTVAKVGNPIFNVVDFHLFTAPIGTPADGYAEFLQTGSTVLQPPYYKVGTQFGITPDQPHPGDNFTTDVRDGVQNAGFAEKTTFTPSEFNNGNGVFLMFMAVPGANAPTGSTPDYASGPVIPNSLFPFTQQFDTYYTDGSLAGTLADSSGVGTLSVLNPQLGGESHIPLIDADNFSFMDPTKGIEHGYEYRIEFRDGQGNGYDVKADFRVRSVPEPAAFLHLGIGICLIGLLWATRRG